MCHTHTVKHFALSLPPAPPPPTLKGRCGEFNILLRPPQIKNKNSNLLKTSVGSSPRYLGLAAVVCGRRW
jgi:hypothetical protein